MLLYDTVDAVGADTAIAFCAFTGIVASVSMAAEISDTRTVWRKSLLFMMNPSVVGWWLGARCTFA